MPKVASPTNYLAARENYQICKYRLRRTEDELLKAFEVRTIADLEFAMLHERSKAAPRFAELTALYHHQHQDLAAADEIFSIATNIQRKRVADMAELDKTISTLDE
jgi:hypothetical protein